jgi:hypothetical protein
MNCEYHTLLLVLYNDRPRSQDTNVLQFKLMCHLASHGFISTVGDPDQSSQYAMQAYYNHD